MQLMILITGAAGKTGRAVLKALLKREAAVRVFVRSREQASELLKLGAAEALIGDLTSREALHTALTDVSSLYHICPNMHPAEVEIGRVVIELADGSGLEHFVYHSVLHPQAEKMPHHWNKLRVEELLFEAGFAFTILQPAPYMQNMLASRDAILEKGVYRVPYPAGTALSLIDLEDLGEAAAIVLTEKGHENAVYELTGTEALTQEDLVKALSLETGRKVRYEEVNLTDWQKAAAASGLSDYGIGTLTKMFSYYAAYGLKGNSNCLCRLVGREPLSLREFIKREIIAR